MEYNPEDLEVAGVLALQSIAASLITMNARHTGISSSQPEEEPTT